MTALMAAGGIILDRVLDATCLASQSGMNRQAFGRFHAARMKTAWGRRCQRSFALVEGDDVLASAEQYDLAGVFDGRAVRISAIGSAFAEPTRPSGGFARVLVEMLFDRAAREGAEMALFFSQIGSEDHAPHDFETIPLTDVTLSVADSPRHGAPMTMVRGGEERDLAAVVAMGRVRAQESRFHLDRDIDFVQYAITRNRLLAGLGPPGTRQLHFFIAEEGLTAAAYVVVSIIGGTWTLEECGDRDVSGARVGALLQALIAREPIERRPTIHAWLPPRFLPPQVTIASASPSTTVLMVRMLDSRATMPRLAGGDVLYWRSDLF